jgi:signal transduction histidine kinase
MTLLDRRSLTFRLILGASLLCAVTLVVAYVLLTALFDLHLKNGVDAELGERLEDLAAGVEIAADGTVSLPRAPDFPKYDRQLSGYYWQIAVAGQDPLRSRSLWDARLPEPLRDVAPGDVDLREIFGPRQERLRLAQRQLQFDDLPAPVVFSAAADLEQVEAAAGEFSRILAIALVVLGIGLVSGVVLQVRVGLRPLDRISATLGAIRAGKESRLAGEMPTEIAPLTSELNALIDHHQAMIERARAQAGDLAHALKTPLSVLRNELEAEEAPDRGLALQQIDAMSDSVQHHLVRARAAASANLIGVRADAAEAIGALARTLPRIVSTHEITVDVAIADPELFFAGEAQDLSELIGNLLENACKWAQGRVAIRAARAGERLLIEIGDDGPGIAPEQRPMALQRGGRLDERAPGSGLGLTIALDLAKLYGGSLTLGQSALGGLLVTVDLPAA